MSFLRSEGVWGYLFAKLLEKFPEMQSLAPQDKWRLIDELWSGIGSLRHCRPDRQGSVHAFWIRARGSISTTSKDSLNTTDTNRDRGKGAEPRRTKLDRVEAKEKAVAMMEEAMVTNEKPASDSEEEISSANGRVNRYCLDSRRDSIPCGKL